MSTDKFKNYTYDLGMLLKEKARAAKYDKDHSILEDTDYNTGYLMAFHEVIDLMKQQAQSFNIEQEEIGLADIDTEMDLL